MHDDHARSASAPPSDAIGDLAMHQQGDALPVVQYNNDAQELWGNLSA